VPPALPGPGSLKQDADAKFLCHRIQDAESVKKIKYHASASTGAAGASIEEGIGVIPETAALGADRAPWARLYRGLTAERNKMRNAALILGIIGGLWGMLIGFFSYGYTEVIDRFGDLGEVGRQVDDVALIRLTSLIAPVLAIAGGAMARSQHVAAGVLLLISTAGMYHAFGFGVFTMFPIAMCGLGGVLALLARTPDAA
jgi:hypothetical protein